MSARTFPRRRFSPARPWAPLSDAEWEALRPHVERPGPGRPLPDLRGRMDAMFRAVTARHQPWRAAGDARVKADTLHRHFRRLAHAGAWTALLRRVGRRRCPKPLRAIRDWICAAHRRAMRILGLAAIVLARRLRLFRALPGPSWMLPDPDLSETLRRVQESLLHRRDDPGLPAALRLVAGLLARAARRARIPRTLVPR